MAGMIKSELWAKYLVELASGKYTPSMFDVNQRLDQDDLRDLGQLLFGESGPQRDAALKLLFMRYMNGGIRNQSELAQSICPALHRIVAESYPQSDLSQSAMTMWQFIECEKAADFLNQWVDKNGITEATAQRVTLGLSFGNSGSFSRLRRFAESHPNAKFVANAVLVLERTAPDWKDKLKDYGRQWRELRDCRTLLHLTNQLVDRRPREDAYIAQIIEVMGEPDSSVDGCYTYQTKEEFHGWLFLETDKNGKIVGWKLDNC